MNEAPRRTTSALGRCLRAMTLAVMAPVCALLICAGFVAGAANPRHLPSTVIPAEADTVAAAGTMPDRVPVDMPVSPGMRAGQGEVRLDDGRLTATPVDTLDITSFEDAETVMRADSVAAAVPAAVAVAADSIAGQPQDEWVRRAVDFNPDPTRAVWLSALFPGLGQIYNRRYWKLPIIVGGYLGLAYATDWNNRMLRDYTRAYADLTDADPTTQSYMDFFPSTTKEDDLDKTWLENTFRSRKNYFRRNRDLCIISMVGVYLLAMVDAYVDASLSHFDITPDLSMDVFPALILDGRGTQPSVGMLWAINF